MSDPQAQAARYTTAEGYERFYVTAVIEGPLYLRLEQYRTTHQISRSDAIKRILHEQLPS